MESHCCLNSFVNLSYIDSVEMPAHLPVKMKPFLCLLCQMDFHADLYTDVITNSSFEYDTADMQDADRVIRLFQVK